MNIGDVQKERHRLVRGKVEKYNICDCGDGEFEWCDKCIPESGEEFKGATYNPYKYKTFVEDVTQEAGSQVGSGLSFGTRRLPMAAL